MSWLRRSTVVPRALWLATRATAPVSGSLSGGVAAALWFVPWQRRRPDPDELAVLGPSERAHVGDAEVVVHVRGEGPTVLLVHGWADRASSLAAFVDPLVAAGHRVVAVDLPAHGDAPGRWTAGPQLARVIAALFDRYQAEAVIAHSLGALATSRALQHAASRTVRRAVLVAPLLRIRDAVSTFGAELRLGDRSLRGLERHVERRFGRDVWHEFAADRNLLGSQVDGLIVHDVDDRRIGIDHARELASVWPSATLLETTGLGHNRILRDRSVVDAVVAHTTHGRTDRSVA